MDTGRRKHVPALLLAKVGLVIPELALNCLGTVWTFGQPDTTGIHCSDIEYFSRTVVEGLVIFEWVLFGLTIFGLIMIFDPMGSKRYQDPQATPGESLRHRKTTRLWLRRFRWLFCWMRSDEYGHEAFEQVAGLFSALFRSTDLVPSDLVAGFVLLRVKQKREVREKRRIQMLSNDEPKYSTDIARVFSVAPRWMNLHDARHFLRLSMAAYGWPFVMYRYPVTGIFRLASRFTCCSCFRRAKALDVTEDNCCLCHLAGVKYWSRVKHEDILFASFKNNIFELPFCVVADHETSNIVIAVRGSISLRDIFTDLVAVSEPFEVEGMPAGTCAHKGMLHGARFVERLLKEHSVLERAFAKHPSYSLVLTGHSLGASVASLLAIKLRPQYPDLKVYAFSCPAGTITREAARITESFIFTVGVGDDFVMRLGVHSIENLRTALIQTLHATRLPKYRIVLNGFGYALFGVPPADLETTWRDETEAGATNGESPLLGERPPLQTIAAVTEASVLSHDINVRRITNTRLYNAGRILYIVHRKKTRAERKAGTGGPSFEMRWAQAEDFMEVRMMPRMLLDHFPENVYETIDKVLCELANDPFV